jgi:predicted ester cyclase
MDKGVTAKAALAPLAALSDATPDTAAAAMRGVFASDAVIRLAHPFNEMAGVDGFLDSALLPLCAAMPDLERRDLIILAGRDAHGDEWVGYCGNYTGTFQAPFLGIPPTGRAAAMRFHEFYRLEDGRAAEMQALWDIPELMMQAGAWPMAPSLGREWHVPAPASQDGLSVSGDAADALRIVGDMLAHLAKHADDGPEAMRLDAFWSPRMAWYGPAGIGTARGIQGFRRHHQIPFLNAMPDRRAMLDKGHFFGEGAYVGFTAWPGMEMTVTGDGWLGIAPTGVRITMRSLDFWRVEAGLIRENWVLVDLLDVYAQLGVDVLARMREMTDRSM